MATWPTFDPALGDDISFIRLYIGDTVVNVGPRPIDEARNFEDETLEAVLTTQGHKNAAVAAMYEILAGEWQRFSISGNEGSFSVNAKDTSDNYWKLAQEWRNKPGGAGPDKALQYNFWPLEKVDHRGIE